MSNKRCEDCYYGHICPETDECEDFLPITEESEDAFFNEVIERGREDFRADWNTYISENQY